MGKALNHRGPDGYGYVAFAPDQGMTAWFDDDACPGNGRWTVGLAHRRLSIVDLSADNRQPMTDEAGRYWLAFNGEIFNYRELRAELEAQGRTFRTAGDTEVVLQAYDAWGEACVERFNGMWAIALFDTLRRSVFLSRDRFGIKPLYFTEHAGTVLFASEIKALLAAGVIAVRPNEKTVSRFLLTGRTDETRDSFFEGIFQIPPGHSAMVDVNAEDPKVVSRPFWSFPEAVENIPEPEAVTRFQSLFFDAVRLHARSDVPIGTSLSGGLDSSSIICAAEKLRQGDDLPNFTHAAFGYCDSDPRLSEQRYMEIAAAASDADLKLIHSNGEMLGRALADVVGNQDEPFGSLGVVAQWMVYRQAARSGMKVIVDGQGADEILSGYFSNFATVAKNRLRRGDVRGYLALRRSYHQEIGQFPASHSDLVRAVLPSSVRKAAGMVRRGLRQAQDPRRLATVLTADLLDREASGELPSEFHSLNDLLAHQVRSSSLPGLLRYADRNSMTHAIEVRLPFLDYRLVEFLFTLPESLKVRCAETKYILREAMRDILPEAIRTRRDKLGFTVTPKQANRYLEDHFEELVANRNEWEARWFSEADLRTFLRESAGNPLLDGMVWQIVSVKLWARRFWM